MLARCCGLLVVVSLVACSTDDPSFQSLEDARASDGHPGDLDAIADASGDGPTIGACSAAPPHGDFPFMISLPSGTTATRIQFWPATGGALSDLTISTTGGTFASPPGACSATLDYDGRWASWIAQPRSFPTGAPQGTAALTFPGAGTITLCELPAGEAAWGAAFDGQCR